MKKLLFFFVAALLAATAAATPKFESGKTYRIVCDLYGGSGITLGARHGSPAELYYYFIPSVPSDAYWHISASGDGYTIQNAVTKEYLQYNPVRVENVCKGISLSSTFTGSDCQWTFRKENSSYYIVSVSQPEHSFNVRTDGTYLVGTYDKNNGNANGLFKFYDENGNLVDDDGGSAAGGSDELKGNSGMTSGGAFWERMGLDFPVVCTTDPENPVLYTIRNVRSGNYVSDSGSGLVQSEGEGTEFYFVQGADGVNIYTSEGRYVSGRVSVSGLGSSAVETLAGTTGTDDNTWSFGYYSSENAGYLIRVQTCSGNTGEEGDNICWNDYGQATVGFYSADGGSSFVFCSADLRHLAYLRSCGVELDKYGADQLSTYADDIRIGGKLPVFDTSDGSYLLSLPESLRDESGASLTLSCTPKSGMEGCMLRLDQKAPDSATGAIDLGSIDCNQDHELSLLAADGAELATATLRFTYLPIVEVNVDNCNGSYYTAGTIRVTDGNQAADAELINAKYRYRGATAQGYAKKAYAIKLTDAAGESLDCSFLGLREDNNWILDAMAIDKACMRNRVSTDLWNDFSTAPYHKPQEKKAITGTRGKFVEVFLNGRYHGLYCFTEKLDRKQLKLKKYDDGGGTASPVIHGSLYKSTQWGYEVLMGHYIDSRYYPKTAPSAYNNNWRSETWADFEVKYPDWEEEKIDWGPLWNAINMVATSSDRDFANQVDEYFDRPVLDDYYLFIELMLATDNHGKNVYYFNYDQQAEENSRKLGFAPWDLDGTWGRNWEGSNSYTQASQDFDSFLWAHEHGNLTLFTRLDESPYIVWSDALKARYAQLRETYFDEDALKARFRDYADLFEASGAAQREEQRWPSLHNNILGDVDYICDWIGDRLDMLDRQYGYTATGLSDAINNAGEYVGATGGTGCIYVHLNAAQTLRVYSAAGQLVRTVQAASGITKVDGISAGVYVVNGKKVLVK